MWTCPTCSRIFEKTKQPHSCHTIPLVQHFQNKNTAKELFELLVKRITKDIGPCRIISLPCCIHLFGNYDFLAALPKKDKLEIRFSLERKLSRPRVTQSVPLSQKDVKNCLDLHAPEDIDRELIHYLERSYHLKDIPSS